MKDTEKLYLEKKDKARETYKILKNNYRVQEIYHKVMGYREDELHAE